MCKASNLGRTGDRRKLPINKLDNICAEGSLVPRTIFFAWQLDRPRHANRDFIWDALTNAAQNAATDSQPELSPRPESDTQGVPGTPNIVQTIFKRIQECAVFVADVTFVGATDGGKKLPNPNVLIELGFAARSIGWERTILVMNSDYGPATELPFDILQHRWPIQYSLTEHAPARDKQQVDKLSGALSKTLVDCEQFTLSRAAERAAVLDTACLTFIAHNANAPYIEMPLPAKTMGQVLTGLEQNLVVRRLMDLGALTIVTEPRLGYAWTYDGHHMIDEVNKLHPQLLAMLKEYTQSK